MRNERLGLVLGVMIIVGLAVAGWYYARSQSVQLVLPYVIPTATPSEVQLVGNDKDEHGCIGSAGYAWCEIKQKCLRSWEEPCLTGEDDAELIKQALYAKNNWNDEVKVTVTVTKSDGVHASGTVTDEQGGGGYVFAIKDKGEWVIVADGNGIIDCDSLKAYPDYPTAYISSCYNSRTQMTVKRE